VPSFLLALAAWVLDALALPIPFSASVGVYLGLALLSGPAVAAGASGVGFLLRAWRNWRNAAAELAPLWLSLGLYALLRPHLHTVLAEAFLLLDAYVILAWLFGEQFVPRRERRSWRRLTARLRPAWLGSVALALPVAWLGQSALWLLPALLALQWAAGKAQLTLRAEEREELRQKLDILTQERSLMSERQLELGRDLQQHLEESLLKEELAKQLGRAPDTRSLLRAVRVTVRALLNPESVVVFEREDDHWAPSSADSPLAHRLQDARLMQVREPLVERVEDKVLALEPEEVQAERLMAGERQALAVRLSPRWALYAGGSQPWSQGQQRLLQVVADLAGPALEAVRERERLREAAQQQGELRTRVDRLEQLSEWSAGLAGALTADQVLKVLQEGLLTLIPHQQSWTGGEAAPLVEAVAESGRPLLLDSVKGTRFPPLAPRLLAVPLPPDGAIVLGRRDPAFTRNEQDLLVVMARQAALALDKSRLHHQVLNAFESLKESEAQLVQSSKLAAVGQLAAGVAHELNTPLATVKLALDSLALREDGPELQLAGEAAERARSIVEKLLFYSREARVAPQAVDLNQVVKDTLVFLEAVLKKDCLEIRRDLRPLPQVLANQNEMQQVVINLLVNARDSLVEAGVAPREVHVRTGTEAGWVWVEVEDSGPGVDPAAADRIFEPFFTTKPVGRGTGLGLSVSQQIMRAHSGQLEYLGGSRFRLRLPER